ncbi:A/G-specific adenine glycosylase [Carboxylicivirga sp. RSCT41]|uniref:A/G-specific adenine glycosylase n=1 Tax=Carboxylicivirga agarovorans TaxID=3417570 RepID=UPI003D3335A3
MTDFAIKLQEWYNTNKRMLPWRASKDPYKVWLSEIIMQQTQVVQGEAYYLKFVENFPTVNDLAKATEQQVLKLWQGLGYYSRARNLHAAAKSIVLEYGGRFPNTFVDILKLKGVGPYTAAAISSICFNEPKAVVDGNVYRFISRIKGVATPIDTTAGKKEFALLADELLDVKNPGDHNQAMMEYGALVCRPAAPACESCIFTSDCYAYIKREIDSLPVKSKKIKQRPRFFHYFLIQDETKIYLEQRSGNDIWKNLYQLPLLETGEKGLSNGFKKDYKGKFSMINQRKHILSHQVIYASFYLADKSLASHFQEPLIVAETNDLPDYPFSQLVANFLREKMKVQED